MCSKGQVVVCEVRELDFLLVRRFLVLVRLYSIQEWLVIQSLLQILLIVVRF